MTWWNQLDKKTGSRPRCVLLVDGAKSEVAERLTKLVNVEGVIVSHDDRWMPYGKPHQMQDGVWDLRPAKEVKLGEPNELLSQDIREELQQWWLAVARNANTPNWDIASTCCINDQPGILLIEAKAHRNELSSSGKTLPTTLNGWKNHKRIGRAIADAGAEIQFLTRKYCAISRDSHYQLSNRFAWSWKLASLGIPVVLVYLGFLDCTEMTANGPLFKSLEGWKTAVNDHCCEAIDKTIWDFPLDFDGVPLISVLRTYNQMFDPTGMNQ